MNYISIRKIQNVPETLNVTLVLKYANNVQRVSLIEQSIFADAF